MDIHVWQLILLVLFLVVTVYDNWNTQVLIMGHVVLAGFVPGLIFGNVALGLQIGATLQLMSLGVAAYGGASVPDYKLGAVIGSSIAITTGQGLEAGLAVAIPVSLLAIQLDVIIRTATSFFIHKAQICLDKMELKRMYVWICSGIILYLLANIVPVLLALTLGKDVVEGVLNAFPDWLVSGLNLAGGILPAVGVAILLRYMNVKNYIAYLLIGFCLSAYLGVPMLGVAIIGIALALIYYKNQSLMSVKLTASATSEIQESNTLGEDEDEL